MLPQAKRVALRKFTNLNARVRDSVLTPSPAAGDGSSSCKA